MTTFNELSKYELFSSISKFPKAWFAYIRKGIDLFWRTTLVPKKMFSHSFLYEEQKLVKVAAKLADLSREESKVELGISKSCHQQLQTNFICTKNTTQNQMCVKPNCSRTPEVKFRKANTSDCVNEWIPDFVDCYLIEHHDTVESTRASALFRVTDTKELSTKIDPRIESKVPSGTPFLWVMRNMFSYRWRFTLNEGLSLNLTVKNLVISVLALNCSFGHLHISHPRNKGKSFKFCAKMSLFSLFIHFSHVDVEFKNSKCQTYHVTGLFAVLDKNVLETLHFTFTVLSPFSRIYQILSLTFTKTMLLFHLLKTHKVYFLKIKEHKMIHTIFNGPGVFCKVLKPSRNVYITSTFQCAVHTVEPQHSTTAGNLTFSSSISEHRHYLYPTGNITINLPSSRFNCSETQCLVFIQMHTNMQINSTILKTCYTGRESQTCAYGGVLILNAKHSKMEEQPTLCETYTSQPVSFPVRNHFYSTHSELVVLLYQYKEYSSMQAVLRIEPTLCQLVELKTNRNHINLTKLNLKTNFPLSWQDHRGLEAVGFSAEEDKCFILQYTCVPEDNANCNLVLEPNVEIGTVMVIEAKGAAHVPTAQTRDTTGCGHNETSWLQPVMRCKHLCIYFSTRKSNQTFCGQCDELDLGFHKRRSETKFWFSAFDQFYIHSEMQNQFYTVIEIGLIPSHSHKSWMDLTVSSRALSVLSVTLKHTNPVSACQFHGVCILTETNRSRLSNTQ